MKMHWNQKLSLTVEDAIEATGYNRSRLYGAIRDGSLRSFKDGRRRMVSRKALEDFITQRERASQGRVA